MKPQITYKELANGLRCVHRRQPSTVEYCGLVVNVGSRDEDKSREGLAHFVEHTIFKGTRRRKAWHIINRMERVGGELNAYTTKEETVVYACFPRGNLSRALELIADLVKHSQFPQRELDKEREVVVDEIKSYLDTPSEAVFDDFEDLFYQGNSLGHNILGNEETIRTFDSEVCRDYLQRYYTPGQMAFFYLGASSPERVWSMVSSQLADLVRADHARDRVVPSVIRGFEHRHELGLHQAHTVIGAEVPGMMSELRYAVALVSNMLGGPGMNSLLNVALRERRGLVYSVDASTSLLTDTGLLTIYFGCDTEDTRRCVDLTMDTLRQLKSRGVTEQRLNQHRRQYLGQQTVASDNSEQVALATGRSLLYRGRAATPQEVIEAYKAISVDNVMEVIEMLQPERCSLLTLS